MSGIWWRRAARVAAAALVVGAAGLGATVPASGQEDPFAPPGGSDTTAQGPSLLQYGWWNKAQQSPAGGNPTPAPPGAPADGLFILYGPSGTPPPAAVTGPLAAVPTAPDPADVRPLGPEAFSAVRFAAPLGAEGVLTLKYTPTSSSQPGGVNPDVGDLFACPIESSWDPVQNGRYDSAPKYSCGNGVAAVVAGDTVTFTLPAALDVDGVFDLALVPMGTRPYRLALAPPSDSSLQLTSVPESSSSEEESFDPGSFEDPAAEFAESPVSEDGFSSSDFGTDTFAVDGTGSFEVADGVTVPSAGGTGGARASGRARPQVASPVATVNPFAPDAGRGERLMAVALLALLGAGLWWVGGQPVRAPRLLGSLGGGAGEPVSAPVPASAPSARGIGRFSRPRPEQRAPRLF